MGEFCRSMDGFVLGSQDGVGSLLAFLSLTGDDVCLQSGYSGANWQISVREMRTS